ncbi:MAG: DUF3576 domain-containing protein [Pseudomonadota bacterium]
MGKRKFNMPVGTALCCLALAVAVTVTGCTGWAPSEVSEQRRRDRQAEQAANSILGEGGLRIGGSRERDQQDQGGGTIGVNSFLWRASLDTVSDLPVASADPFGGVILTDWHAPDGSGVERFKINIFILGRQLRADGLTVSVFRQVRAGEGWEDAAVAEGTARAIEDTILTRARELRIVSAQLQ